MDRAELDDLVGLCAKRFVKGMDRKGWLGEIMAESGLDPSGVTDDEVHEILVKTIMKLEDAFEEEIEIEQEEEGFGDEEEADEDEDDFLDDEEEDLD
jgi:hypothetical protein